MPASSSARPVSPEFVLVFASLCLGTTLVFYWPGSVSLVPVDQWDDARTATITQAYAPFMSFVWRWLDMLLPGPGLMLALQLLIFWSAIAVLLFNLRLTRWWFIAGLVVLGVNPLAVAFSSAILKDVFSGNLALLGFAILLGYKRSSHRTRVLVLSFSMFGLAGLVRYQMWSVALPALVGIIIYDRMVTGRTWRQAVAGAGTGTRILADHGAGLAPGDCRHLLGQAGLH